MSSGEDFWGGYGGETQEESQPNYDQVPARAVVLVRTTTEENGGGACKVKSFSPKDNPDKTIYQLSLGTIVVGGGKIGGKDSKLKVESKFNNKYVFGGFWVHPKEGEGEEGKVPPRLVGVLNGLFSSGVGNEHIAAKGATKDEKAAGEAKRSEARWKNTLKQLQAAAELEGITREQFTKDGKFDFPLMIAKCAEAALKRETRVVLVRTGEQKRQDGTKETNVSAVLDLTKESMEEYSVEVFEEEYAPIFNAGATF